MKNKQKKQKKHPKFWLGFKIFIFVFLLAILGGGIFLYEKYGKTFLSYQDEAVATISASTEDDFMNAQNTIAYNSKGKQIAILKGDKDAYYMKLEQIPDYVKNAFIVTEDRKFYAHKGIDVEAIGRACLQYVKTRRYAQGGSTITQQLARGTFLTQKKEVSRKVKEIFLAMEMEKKYSKEQILEFYLNNIYFSNGYYGIEAAAKGYFSRSCTELSLSQLAFLCSIPNNPSLYDPNNHMDNTLKRRDRILEQMLSEEVISQEEYDAAIAEKIELKIKEPAKRNYVTTFVTYCATRKIMEMNGFDFRYQFDSKEDRESYQSEYDEAYDEAQKMLVSKGYRIYTSIDLKKQKKLQKSINDELKGFKEKETNGIYKMQGAGVCIDNETGRVVAAVGGRSQRTVGYTLNRSYQAFRQPGSCMKPLAVYTPSLERNYTADSTVNDHKFEGGPSNSDGSYAGYVSLRYAVEKSKNTVAWQLFDELTPKVGLEYLLKMHFGKIVDSDYYNAASIGGLTYGCSPLEMASGYATIENDGRFREPTCIVRITDSAGNELLKDKVDEKFIYKKKAANAMVDILKGVLTRGTGVGLALDNGMIAAGKTGTTNDKKDGWFCGFTPYYTTAIWIGCDTPKTVDDLYGNSYPGRVWNSFMNKIHTNLEPIPFPYEAETGTHTVTQSSGSGYSGSSGGSSDSDPSSTDPKDTDADDDDNQDDSDSSDPSSQSQDKDQSTDTDAGQGDGNGTSGQTQQSGQTQGGDTTGGGGAGQNAGSQSQQGGQTQGGDSAGGGGGQNAGGQGSGGDGTTGEGSQ
mgnify:CR=1 FL=1